jgi:hypothetical protein
MNKMQVAVLVSVLFSMLHTVYAQDKFGVGVSAIYNFQTEAFGVGARAEIGIVNRLSVVPQGLYFFQFNKVHEVEGAINLHYRLFYLGRFYGYLLAGGTANYWMNYAESHYDKAKPFNVIAQVGGGMAYGDGKFRPFAEYWYNPIWKEGSVHVGLMYYPEWNGRNKGDCPAYR